MGDNEWMNEWIEENIKWNVYNYIFKEPQCKTIVSLEENGKKMKLSSFMTI